MKKSLLLIMLCTLCNLVYSQNCVGSGTANVSFVSSSGGVCVYNIAMSVTTTQNSAKAVRFSILNASPSVSPVCKTSSSTIINCANTGNLNNIGNNVVITHTFTNVSIPCNTAPNVNIEGTTANNDFSSLCTAITVTQTNPSPVKLSYFKAIANLTEVNLTWQTEVETNSNHFVVQRSGNAQEFGDLASIKTAGESTQKNNYKFVDKNPLPGINYYRLRQVDNDGSFTFSKIIDIKSEGGVSETIIYPNPSVGSFEVTTKEPILSSEVYNAAGKAIDIKLIQKGNSYSVDFGKTPESGLYFLKIKTRSGITNYRVVIQ
jgi:Secretion system C-terminal sorting domain